MLAVPAPAMSATTSPMAEFVATVSAKSVAPASAVIATPLPFVSAAAAGSISTPGVGYTVPVPGALEALAPAVCCSASVRGGVISFTAAASFKDVAAPLSLIAVGSSSDSRSSPLPRMPRLSAVSPLLHGGGFRAGGCGALGC